MSELNTEEVVQEPIANLSPENEAALDALMPDFEPEPEKQKEPAPDKQTEEMIGAFYGVAFGIAATRLGEHWALSEDEVRALSEPTVAVLNKYAPNAKVGPEAALLGAVVMVVMPRLMVPKEEPVPEEPDAITDEQEAADGHQPQHPAQ